LEPDSETAHNELGYIEDLRRKREAEKEEIPWFLHSFVNPPTDPLTIRLLALVEDLPSIPGPKTVGSENYSRIFDAFMKRGYTPAPMPIKSLTVTREASDGGVKQTTTGERVDGTAINANYTAKYDGKDVQVSGNSQYDTIAIKQLNANTLTDERKKTGGPYKATGRTVVSNGGKTMTTTTKGTNADGKEFTQVLVFDKQ